MPRRTDHPADRTRVRWVGPTSGGGVDAVFRPLSADADVSVLGLGSEQPPDLVVVASPAPAPDPRAIEGLAARVDCPVVQLLGAWCEGEGRTGRPPQGVERVFWHEWPDWWSARERRAASGSAFHQAAIVQIVTPRREDAEAIGGVLHDAGFATAWGRDERSAAATVRGVGCAIWCGTQLDGFEADRLAALGAAVRPTPIVAMLDFPRPETVAAARELGAARVLGRPCDADALVACVRSQVAARRRRSVGVRVAEELGVERAATGSEDLLPAAA